MDYPRRRRLKLYARLEARDLATDADLAAKLELPGCRALVERAFVLQLEAFDWNCPQYITPRFTEAEMAPLTANLAELEAENAALRAALAEKDPPA